MRFVLVPVIIAGVFIKTIIFLRFPTIYSEAVSVYIPVVKFVSYIREI